MCQFSEVLPHSQTPFPLLVAAFYLCSHFTHPFLWEAFPKTPEPKPNMLFSVPAWSLPLPASVLASSVPLYLPEPEHENRSGALWKWRRPGRISDQLDQKLWEWGQGSSQILKGPGWLRWTFRMTSSWTIAENRALLTFVLPAPSPEPGTIYTNTRYGMNQWMNWN